VDLLTDYQLQIEHALDLQGREQVVFVDADVSLEVPFAYTAVSAEMDASYSTHAMTPGAVLQVVRQIGGRQPFSCFLLAIRGYRFSLGTRFSEQAEANLERAERFLLQELISTRPACTEY
jgi:hydrogenase maturation protease